MKDCLQYVARRFLPSQRRSTFLTISLYLRLSRKSFERNKCSCTLSSTARGRACIASVAKTKCSSTPPNGNSRHVRVVIVQRLLEPFHGIGNFPLSPTCSGHKQLVLFIQLVTDNVCAFVWPTIHTYTLCKQQLTPRRFAHNQPYMLIFQRKFTLPEKKQRACTCHEGPSVLWSEGRQGRGRPKASAKGGPSFNSGRMVRDLRL